MDHDQSACMRCGEPAGGQRFCESCRSQLDLASETGGRGGADAGDASYSGVQTGREVRLEQAAAAGEHLTIDVRGSLTVDVRERTQPAREVARFEELLAPAPTEADRVLAACRWADAVGDPQGATHLGVLLEQRGDLEGAIAAYRRGDERGDVNGSFNLGCLLAELGDEAGALTALRRADERGDAAGASNLGLLLEREGDVDGALAAYRRADERGDAYGSFNLGLLLAGRGDLRGARAAYRRAAERGDPEMWRRAAQAEADATPAEDVSATATADPTAAATTEAEAPIDERAPQPAVLELDPGRTTADIHETSRRHWVAVVSGLALLFLVALLTRRGLRRLH